LDCIWSSASAIDWAGRSKPAACLARERALTWYFRPRPNEKKTNFPRGANAQSRSISSVRRIAYLLRTSGGRLCPIPPPTFALGLSEPRRTTPPLSFSFRSLRRHRGAAHRFALVAAVSLAINAAAAVVVGDFLSTAIGLSHEYAGEVVGFPTGPPHARPA
jgi:hypothetical protein